MPAIEVSHVTKEYRLGALQSLKQTMLNTGARLLGRPVEQAPLFKALDDVSFSIEPGEVVGIIGHNGAGKSTLLKMLARISTPTHGTVRVNGRIAPLIEVGAGFVPDFTGRENVYLNGAILGMSKKEIDRKFEEIVDFAEMGEFIDTPVKRYSSGMQVKLAFAVATSIEAEVLIVDEVLAVGDLAFQRKCFDRMEQLIKRERRTVLLVSHNIRQVVRLCKRTILMDHGRAIADGASSDVCGLFYSQSDERILRTKNADSQSKKLLTTGVVSLDEIAILDSNGSPVEQVYENSSVSVRLRLTVRSTLHDPVFAIGVHTTDFLYLASPRSEGLLNLGEIGVGHHEFICRIDYFPFLAGVYSLRASVAAGSPRIDHFYGESLLRFSVLAKHKFQADLANEGFIGLETSWAHTEVCDNKFNNAARVEIERLPLA